MKICHLLVVLPLVFTSVEAAAKDVEIRQQDHDISVKTVTQTIYPITIATNLDNTCAISRNTDQQTSIDSKTSKQESLPLHMNLYNLISGIVLAAISYFLVPVYHTVSWIVRVLIFRPAVFIYFLFLAQPFHAALSVAFWLLPPLSFILATTILGVLIGGAFGWVSALAVGQLKSPESDTTTSQLIEDIDVASQAASTSQLQHKSNILQEELQLLSTIDQQPASFDDSPAFWTRRRRPFKRDVEE